MADGAVALQDLDAGRVALLERLARQQQIKRYLDYYCDTPWARWLVEVLPHVFVPAGEMVPFSAYQAEFWQWVWAIEPNAAPEPLLAVWPRDGGKSSCAEAATIYLCGEGIRRYCGYASQTQDQADRHVQSVSALLEHPTVHARYPRLCSRKLTAYGQARGWRINRLWTEQGAVIDALGLDKATRGARVDEQRLDLLWLDDIDEEHDSPRTVAKKEETITMAILPAGDRDRLAVGVMQNIVHDASCVARLLDGKADYLARRRVSGPHPAIEDFAYEEIQLDEDRKGWRITQGTATWGGLSLAVCEEILNRIGPRAFLREHQHQRGTRDGALWTWEMIDACRAQPGKDLVRITVNVDPPAGGTTPGSEAGITVTARDAAEHGYLLADLSGHYRPEGWGQVVAAACEEWDADCVVGEINQGGDMVRAVIHSVNPDLRFVAVRAKRGKAIRAEPVAQLYERGIVHHAGTFRQLEEQLVEPYDPYHPTIKFDRMDSAVYGFTYLLIGHHDVLRNLDPNIHRVPRPGPGKAAVGFPG